jgi:hypothetical protein
VCDAKIRPLPDDIELQCNADHSGPGGLHQAVLHDYAYPGSTTTIYWQEGDRRNFRGEFTPCDQSTCLLPAGHHGDHAS